MARANNVLSHLIFVPNVLVAGILGPPLLAALYPRVKKWGLLYRDIMPAGEGSDRLRWMIVLLLFLGIASGYLIGNAFYFGIAKGAAGNLSLALCVAPSIGIMLLALALL